MKKKDLLSLGIPESCLSPAVECVKAAGKRGFFHGKTAKKVLRGIVEDPDKFSQDENFALFAQALLAEKQSEPVTPHEPIPFKQWGTDIEPAAIEQMKQACALPVSVGAAMMPDAHLGYGLPVGGVLATYNSVIPFCVGVDIACRMKLSIIDKDPQTLNDVFGGKEADNYADALYKGTRFGIGSTWNPHLNHEVMDEDWNITSITKSLKDKALQQLGTSGSGNHFVEIGLLQVEQPTNINGTEVVPGKYVAILSHSGSRGAGANVCNYYSGVAKNKLPRNYKEFHHLAWLDLDSEAGQEYWLAMNLMGEYASANHALIHRNVAALIGADVMFTVENHHNFAWKETHNGQEVYVHRKGATPAGVGVLGIIPGSMADPGFLVKGRGDGSSLHSASHGAGRRMSRTQAIKTFTWAHWKSVLKQRGVRLLAAGLDEVPGAYKDIETVMRQQQDLVEVLARFDPKIVLMSDDGKRED